MGRGIVFNNKIWSQRAMLVQLGQKLKPPTQLRVCPAHEGAGAELT